MASRIGNRLLALAVSRPALARGPRVYSQGLLYRPLAPGIKIIQDKQYSSDVNSETVQRAEKTKRKTKVKTESDSSKEVAASGGNGEKPKRSRKKKLTIPSIEEVLEIRSGSVSDFDTTLPPDVEEKLGKLRREIDEATKAAKKKKKTKSSKNSESQNVTNATAATTTATAVVQDEYLARFQESLDRPSLTEQDVLNKILEVQADSGGSLGDSSIASDGASGAEVLTNGTASQEDVSVSHSTITSSHALGDEGHSGQAVSSNVDGNASENQAIVDAVTVEVGEAMPPKSVSEELIDTAPVLPLKSTVNDVEGLCEVFESAEVVPNTAAIEEANATKDQIALAPSAVLQEEISPATEEALSSVTEVTAEGLPDTATSVSELPPIEHEATEIGLSNASEAAVEGLSGKAPSASEVSPIEHAASEAEPSNTLEVTVEGLPNEATSMSDVSSQEHVATEAHLSNAPEVIVEGLLDTEAAASAVVEEALPNTQQLNEFELSQDVSSAQVIDATPTASGKDSLDEPSVCEAEVVEKIELASEVLPDSAPEDAPLKEHEYSTADPIEEPEGSSDALLKTEQGSVSTLDEVTDVVDVLPSDHDKVAEQLHEGEVNLETAKKMKDETIEEKSEINPLEEIATELSISADAHTEGATDEQPYVYTAEEANELSTPDVAATKDAENEALDSPSFPVETVSADNLSCEDTSSHAAITSVEAVATEEVAADASLLSEVVDTKAKEPGLSDDLSLDTLTQDAVTPARDVIEQEVVHDTDLSSVEESTVTDQDKGLALDEGFAFVVSDIAPGTELDGTVEDPNLEEELELRASAFPEDEEEYRSYLAEYKVGDYHGYNPNTYFDLEVEMEEHRMPQPSSRDK